MATITLPYGTEPYQFEVSDHVLVEPPAVPEPAGSPLRLARRALDLPIGGTRLDERVQAGDRVVVIVSDDSRADPRATLIRALRERLPSVKLTVAIANGTHGPCQVEGLELGLDDGVRVVNHDCDDRTSLVVIGHSRRGTPFAVHRCIAEADWVVATGCIRPHYFAGFGGGCKALFPGLGGRTEIRRNHALKAEAGAQPGAIQNNPCRRDMEEVLEHLPGEAFLLNLVVDSHERAHYAVAGDVVAAFRHGAELCRPLHQVAARPTSLIVASAGLPVAASLYQASKIIAAVAGLLAPGGTLVLAAECGQGVGGIDVVNRAIYDIGLRPRLPAEHDIFLVSSLAQDVVEATYCRWATSVENVLNQHVGQVPTIIPQAAELLVVPI